MEHSQWRRTSFRQRWWSLHLHHKRAMAPFHPSVFDQAMQCKNPLIDYQGLVGLQKNSSCILICRGYLSSMSFFLLKGVFRNCILGSSEWPLPPHALSFVWLESIIQWFIAEKAFTAYLLSCSKDCLIKIFKLTFWYSCCFKAYGFDLFIFNDALVFKLFQMAEFGSHTGFA